MAIERVTKTDNLVALRHALVSVSNKTGLEAFIRELAAAAPGITFYSTGGTFSVLQPIVASLDSASLVAVTDFTGQPEMRGGLVKTLDYRIYLGLLCETYNRDHQQDIERLAGVRFDMAVVNLYPFQRVVTNPNLDIEDARGNIDIGGPAMLRAAAKNFLRVTAVCDPSDYQMIVDHLRQHAGACTLQMRKQLAQKVFRTTSEYDAAIAAYLEGVTAADLEAPYVVNAESP